MPQGDALTAVSVVQAVIHEVQRMADTAPLSIFHSTTKDTELMGYSIPRVSRKYHLCHNKKYIDAIVISLWALKMYFVL